MTRIAPSWIVAIALTGILHLSVAQTPAVVPATIVGSMLGGRTNFTCQSHGIPISTCLWERDPPSPGQNGLILNFNPGNAKPDQGPLPGYVYLGDGLEKGECGVIIQNVKEEDNGNWKCTLITNSGLYRGVVDVNILRKPDPPLFSPSKMVNVIDSDDDRARQQDAKITCYSTNGHPTPKLMWFIDNERVTDELAPANVTIKDGIPYTYQAIPVRRFTWRDNGKKLRCVVQHDALLADDVKETSMDIDIKFAPRTAPEDVGRDVNVRAEIGTEKVLSVNVSANPIPDQVLWTVDGKVIREGDDKYVVQKLVDLKGGVYQANLRIKSVSEEDVNKNFILKLTNNFGEAKFDLKVASDVSGSGGLSAGGIVLLILGIAALLIIIALVVVYARSQGLLCFKGDGDSHSTAHIDGKNSDLGESGGNENPASGDGGGYPPSQTPPLGPPQSKQNGDDGTASEKERMDDGSTGGVGDEPQQQQKPGLKLTSRLSALYDNLLNKKKDKPVPVDEESATATKDKEPVQESSTPVKPPGTPANPPPNDIVEPISEKKPEDIVYAELDLARSGVGGNGPNPEIVVRADDKTEYAEIVGVVSASTLEGHKKSPSASSKSGSSETEK